MKNINLFSPIRVLLAMGAFAACSSLALAQYASGKEASTLKHGDRSFIEKAAKSSMEEVAISQAVLERTSNPQVKDLAQMLVNDHTKANTALADIAAAKSVSLPVAEAVPGKWTKKTDKDYDEDFVDKVISEHKSAVKLFTEEANDGKDPETVAFARSTLLTLQQHLEQAQILKKSFK